MRAVTTPGRLKILSLLTLSPVRRLVHAVPASLRPPENGCASLAHFRDPPLFRSGPYSSARLAKTARRPTGRIEAEGPPERVLPPAFATR